MPSPPFLPPGEARRVIERGVADGLTYEQMAARINYTPKWAPLSDTAAAPTQQQQQQVVPKAAAPAKKKEEEDKKQQQQQQQQQAPPAKKKEEAPKAKVEVGATLGTPKRNPLDMIKVVGGGGRGGIGMRVHVCV